VFLPCPTWNKNILGSSRGRHTQKFCNVTSKYIISTDIMLYNVLGNNLRQSGWTWICYDIIYRDIMIYNDIEIYNDIYIYTY